MDQSEAYCLLFSSVSKAYTEFNYQVHCSTFSATISCVSSDNTGIAKEAYEWLGESMAAAAKAIYDASTIKRVALE